MIYDCNNCPVSLVTTATLGDERHLREHGYWRCTCGGRIEPRINPRNGRGFRPTVPKNWHWRTRTEAAGFEGAAG